MAEPVLAYVSQIRWPSEIPAGPFNANYMLAMARAGVTVHFIVRSPLGEYSARYSDPLDVLRGEYGHDAPSNLHIHVIPTPGWKPASDRGLYFWRAGRLVRRLIRTRGVNCVMSRDTLSIGFLARWQRQAGVIAVHDTHNFYMDPVARDDAGRGYPWTQYPALERKHLPRLAGVITLLETQAEWYRRHLSNPILAAHPGVSRICPPDPRRSQARMVGYVGSLSGMKGSMNMLAALQMVEQTDVRMLLIGGRGEGEVAEARRTIAEMGLNGRVEVTGWLSVPELRRRLDEVAIALLPLEDRFYNRYLTAPSKLFDYLGDAIPVIASDLPAVRELAGDAAEYVAPGDTLALAQAMERLLQAPERQRALADAAHRRAHELSWNHRGRQTYDFLSNLLARR